MSRCPGRHILGDMLREMLHENSAGLNACVMKQGQSDPSFQCRIVCTALVNCPRYNIEMNQYHVHELAYCPWTCVLCVHTKGFVPASRPRNKSSSVCRPGNFCASSMHAEGCTYLTLRTSPRSLSFFKTFCSSSLSVIHKIIIITTI